MESKMDENKWITIRLKKKSGNIFLPPSLMLISLTIWKIEIKKIIQSLCPG